MKWGQNFFKIMKSDDLPATQTEKSWRKLTRLDKKIPDVCKILGNDSWYGDLFSFKPVAWSFLCLEWAHLTSHEA